MKRRITRPFFGLTVLLLATLACSLPGLSAPTPFVFPTPDLTMTAIFNPTLDPNVTFTSPPPLATTTPSPTIGNPASDTPAPEASETPAATLTSNSLWTPAVLEQGAGAINAAGAIALTAAIDPGMPTQRHGQNPPPRAAEAGHRSNARLHGPVSDAGGKRCRCRPGKRRAVRKQL